MYIYQGLVILALLLLLIPKSSRQCSVVLLASLLVYYIIFNVEYSPYYYILSALKDLITGLFLEIKNRKAAICSYILVFANAAGLILWYNYQEPFYYDLFCCFIVIIQLLFIIPTRLLGYGNTRNNSTFLGNYLSNFVCFLSCVKMR